MSPIKKTILYCIFFFMDVDHAEASTAIPPQDRFDLHHHSHKAYEGDNLALAHSLPQSSSSSSSSSSLASYIAGIVRGTAAKWGKFKPKKKVLAKAQATASAIS